MRRPLSLLLFACAVPGAADAQDIAPEIVVIGTELPLPPGMPAYGTVTIGRERLESAASGRIEEVLADVAGFQQFRRSDSRSANPSAQGATLRALGGNASSRALVLLDGVPMADPFFGYIPFSAIVPDRLSAVRVTRGGGAGAFGAGAVAGTIELASAARSDLPLLSASGFYGSHDATELSASLSPDLGSGFVSLSGRWDRGDGFQTTPADQRTSATVPAAYDGWSAGLRAVAPVSGDLEFQTRLLMFRDARTLRFAGANSASEGEDASVGLVSRGRWQFDVLAYVQSRNFSNIVISATSFTRVLDQRNTLSTGLGGKVELRPPVGDDHVLRIGADARLAEGELFEDAYAAVSGLVTSRRNAGGRTSTAGLFVEDDWTIGRLVLTGGGRADRWTVTDGFFTEANAAGTITTAQRFAARSGWRTSGRLGALYRASDAVALRAAAYTGFRLPTLNELYRPFTVFPIATRANAGLRLERLEGVEAGVEVTPAPGIQIAATLFDNRLEDAIANVTIGPNLRERRNVDAVAARGIELTASAQLADFHLSASYAYSHNIVRGSGDSAALDGFAPAQSPRHAAAATLAWAPRSGPSLATTVRYVGKQFEDDLESDVLPSAITLDAVARLPLRRDLTLVGRAENIFDETVVTRNSGGSIDLGTPRTLWIGLRFER